MTRRTFFVVAFWSVVLTACTAAHFPKIRTATRAAHGRRSGAQATQDDGAASLTPLDASNFKARWAVETIAKMFAGQKAFQPQGHASIKKTFQTKSPLAERRQNGGAPSFEYLDRDGNFCVSLDEFDAVSSDEDQFNDITALSSDNGDCGDDEISAADYQVATGGPPAFTDLDTNDNDCISEAEFNRALNNTSHDHGGPGCPFEYFTGQSAEESDCGADSMSRADFEAAFSESSGSWPPSCPALSSIDSFDSADRNNDNCVNASEWKAAVPPDTPPGQFGYMAGFASDDRNCTDAISRADFETWLSAAGGPYFVPCTPTRGCLTIISAEAANYSQLSIAGASFERRTWDMSALSMDDTSPQSDQSMTILAFEVRFNSSIALNIQLPGEDVLRYVLQEEPFAEEIVDLLSGWNRTAKSLNDMRSIVEGLGSDTLLTANHLIFEVLFNILPLDMRLQCSTAHDSQSQGVDNSFVPFYTIPPIANAVPNFLHKMIFPESKTGLFRNVTWQSDMFFVVVPVGGMGPGRDMGPQLDHANCRMLVGDIPVQKFTDTSSDCTVEELLDFGELVTPFLSSLDESGSSNKPNDLFKKTMVLSLLKLMDGYERCKSMLESMIKTSNTMVWTSGQRSCEEKWGTDEWKEDPCCNPAKAFEQCCGLKTELQNIPVIDSISIPAAKCDVDKHGFKLNSALLSFSTVDRLRRDSAMGCAAARKKKFSQKSFSLLFDFIELCERRIYNGKTKAGQKTCNQDSECYTTCDANNNKCALPFAGPEKAFLQCGLDHMDPALVNWLRKNNGVSSLDRSNALEKALQSKYAEDRCTGPSQDVGVCLVDFEQKVAEREGTEGEGSGEGEGEGEDTETQSNTVKRGFCDANVFNQEFDTSKVHALNAALRPLETKLGFSGNGIYTTWVQGAPEGLGCRVNSESFKPEEYSCPHPCILDEESPFFALNASFFCTKLAKALAAVNGLDENLTTGTYISLNPEYERKYNTDTGMLDRVRVSNGSEFWCEHARTCNHMSPWDDGAADTKKCVTNYAEGGSKAMFGTSFCAKCDGPVCYEVSSPPVCKYQMHSNKSCSAEDGIFFPWDMDGQDDPWGDCFVDAKANHTVESCFGESFQFCPKEIRSWVDDEGKTQSYTSYGFCEYMYVCHAPQMDQSACEQLTLQDDGMFPRFIGKSNTFGLRHRPDHDGNGPGNTKAAKSLATHLRKILPMRTDKRDPAHKRAHALGARMPRDSGEIRRVESGEDACENDREWSDSQGNHCDSYEENPIDCFDAEYYQDDTLHSAVDKCCVCMGLLAAFEISNCKDDTDWVDSAGDNCEVYHNNTDDCSDAALYADESGEDASTKCCVCKVAEGFMDGYYVDFGFAVVDTDGDGCLSEADLSALVQDKWKSDRTIGNQTIQDNWKSDATGFPTFEMIAQVWGVGPDASFITQETFEFVTELTRFFVMNDGNKDWCISLNEFRLIFNSSEDDSGDHVNYTAMYTQIADQVHDDACHGSNASISINDFYVDVNSPTNGDSGDYDPISPKHPMCVLYAGYDGSGIDNTNSWNTKSKCTATEGYKWMAPRSFDEGKWNTETSCKSGVCSSSPWNWELAKNPGKCNALGGICSRQCTACESKSPGPTEFCIATSIKNSSDCTMKWNEAHKMCYGTLEASSECYKRKDKNIMSCFDVQVGNNGCAKPGWSNDRLYNGTEKISGEGFGLDCFTNYYGVCKDKKNCESGGSCNDWTYANWGAEYEDTSTCRIPFTKGADWGGPDVTTCYSLSPQYTASAWMEDACIVYDMKTSDCTASGGTPVSRADTEAKCTRFKGCFDTNHNTITAVNEAQCSHGDICDPNQFEWKNVLEWTPGVWSASKMTSAGMRWTERKLEPQNMWSKVIPYDTLVNQVYEAAFAMAAEAFVGQFNCEMEPLKAILETVSCACGRDREAFFSRNGTGSCDKIMDELIEPSAVLSKTVYLSDKAQTLAQPGFGSVGFDHQDLRVSSKKGSDSVTIELAYTNAMMLRDQTSDRRAVTSTSVTCGQFDVVKNSNSETVGQLAGNGLQVKGLKDTTVSICVPASEAIPYCSSLLRYTVPDFAIGDVNGRPGVLLKLSVSIDKANQFCGNVRLGDKQTMLYPVLRTDNMLPGDDVVVRALIKSNVGESTGEGLQDSMTLSGMETIKNMNQFVGGLAMMAAFRNCVASSLAYVSKDLAAISSNSIVLLKVCDVQDSTLDLCIDLSANTVTRSGSNTREGPIRVTYLIIASDTLVDAIQSALQMDAYVSKFQALFTAQGYKVTATRPKKPTQPKPFEIVPKDSPFFLVLVVSMPYSKAEFTPDVQKKFIQAIASTAGTSPLNIEIISITDVLGRRSAGSVDVETKIRAASDASLSAMQSTLGSGDTLKNKLNAELKKQGLKESTGVRIMKKWLDELSGGAIASIVCGSLLGVVVCGCCSFYLAKMHKKNIETFVVDSPAQEKTVSPAQEKTWQKTSMLQASITTRIDDFRAPVGTSAARLQASLFIQLQSDFRKESAQTSAGHGGTKSALGTVVPNQERQLSPHRNDLAAPLGTETEQARAGPALGTVLPNHERGNREKDFELSTKPITINPLPMSGLIFDHNGAQPVSLHGYKLVETEREQAREASHTSELPHELAEQSGDGQGVLQRET